jgi:hypothetical protein
MAAFDYSELKTYQHLSSEEKAAWFSPDTHYIKATNPNKIEEVRPGFG